VSAVPEDVRALVVRAQGGDVRAFERLVDAHLSRLRRYARSFVASPADADELAQEALVKVYKHLGAYRFQASFDTWLYVVVRHAFLDQVRSRAGREAERRKVWAALRTLPEEYRTAVLLYDLEGHSYEEVAAIQEVPIGTVKSRLARGRRMLGEALGTNREGVPSNAQAGKT
jgi:RNA polymerase sigma-70 factor (ECF subfamily)